VPLDLDVTTPGHNHSQYMNLYPRLQPDPAPIQLCHRCDSTLVGFTRISSAAALGGTVYNEAEISITCILANVDLELVPEELQLYRR
jgi:hypothetical protein